MKTAGPYTPFIGQTRRRCHRSRRMLPERIVGCDVARDEPVRGHVALGRNKHLAWRGDQARTPGGASGNGLGLPIVRTIVAAHARTAEIRNRPPGCVVTIELPRTASG